MVISEQFNGHASDRRGLSRRSLFQIGGVAAAAVSSVMLMPGKSWAADNDVFDDMRTTWVHELIGAGYDHRAEPFASKLAASGLEGRTAWDTMAPSATSLWPDLPIAVGMNSDNINNSYQRIKLMAFAYAQPGTGVTGDKALASAVCAGLDWMVANAYTPTSPQYGNWWNWMIGGPQRMLDACTLVYSHLTPAQVSSYMAAVDAHVPTSVGTPEHIMTPGANLIDTCRIVALRGVLEKTPAKIEDAQLAVSMNFPYVTKGDGLYADGSYIQHGAVPYASGYGEVMMRGVGQILALLGGTPWEVTDPAVQNVFDAVTLSFAPFIWNGLVMDGVAGRGVSRGLSATTPYLASDHSRGHFILGHLLRLALSNAPSMEQKTSWKQMLKGWIERDTWFPYISDSGAGIPDLARMQALINDPSITASPEPINSRVFGMDRAVHRREGWAAQISMCSSRTSFYEAGNGENIRGWHQNSGMLYVYGFGDDQYSDNFWSTVSPYRLPGTTVSTKPLANSAGGDWNKTAPTNTWAGGASDGTFSVAGQDVRGMLSSLQGKKSWFLLDDSIVCLGAGIACTDGTGVQTTIDNRNLGAGKTRSLTVDGVVQPIGPGWESTFASPKYMTIDGMGSYVFFGSGAVNAQRTPSTGSWSSINTGYSKEEITRNYLTLWVDHGTDPVDAGYSYQLMPGATAAQAAARAKDPNVKILANTESVQAVHIPSLRMTMANFFEAGSVGPITVSAPCSVLVRKQKNTMSVYVSDPGRTSSSIVITLDEPGYKAVSNQSGITVISTAKTVQLLMEVDGALGTTQTVTLNH